MDSLCVQRGLILKTGAVSTHGPVSNSQQYIEHNSTPPFLVYIVMYNLASQQSFDVD